MCITENYQPFYQGCIFSNVYIFLIYVQLDSDSKSTKKHIQRIIYKTIKEKCGSTIFDLLLPYKYKT